MSLDQPEELFWSLTLREVAAIQNGVLARLRREHNELAWHAWHVAALPKAKKMPTLAAMQKSGTAQEVRRQSWSEQASILENW